MQLPFVSFLFHHFFSFGLSNDLSVTSPLISLAILRISGGKTPRGVSTNVLRERGGWSGRANVSESPYWALADSWLYLMGDSTTRQLWGAYATPFNGNNFERNAKEWSRENCDR